MASKMPATASAVTRDSLAAIETPAHVAALGGAPRIAAAIGAQASARGWSLPSARVEQNRAAFGENRLPHKAARSFWSHLVDALGDDTLKILIFSATVSLLFAIFFSKPENRQADSLQAISIFVAIVAVSSINSYQNWTKDAEFESLEALKADKEVTVVRDGAAAAVSVYDVVVGDVLRLSAGFTIPCDGVLVSGSGLSVNESKVTGEANPVFKGVGAGENLVIVSNTDVTEGEGEMIVTAVGPVSKVGKLVGEIENVEHTPTPLQEALTELADTIGKGGLAAGVLTFAVLSALWYLRTDPGKSIKDLIQYFIMAVSIVVVAVPEGLPLAVTISLAFSMKRMMKDNNLVRRLDACETMGSSTVLCSDKTGTLTQNRMEVVEAFLFATHCKHSAEVSALLREFPGARDRLCKAIALNSAASLRSTDAGQLEFVGNPTDGALLLLTKKFDSPFDYDVARAEAGAPLARRPFTRTTLTQTTVVRAEERGQGPIVYVTGAPEKVLPLVTQSGQLRYPTPTRLTDDDKHDLTERVRAMASHGLRVIAIAYRRLDKGAAAGAADELLAGADGELTLVGLFGIADPLRAGVSAAVAKVQAAGMRVIMVTGDHIDTAKFIARQAGILGATGAAVEGAAYRALGDTARRELAGSLSVLARCSPLDKVMLVSDLQAAGEVVAVTGDGTNDAPALSKADIGLAMGIAGTDVAKDAADIVIMDDAFSSIVATVRWGRSIKENIRKFLTFQLTINIVALTLTFVSACASGGRTDSGGLNDLPLKPVQLLWVNLIMDTFAALALATEPPGERLMLQPPQGRTESLITRIMYKNMIGHAAWQMAVLLWMTHEPTSAAWFGLVPADLGTPLHDTIIFNTFVIMQVFNIFNCRSVNDEWNILEDFSESVIAQFIIALIVILQVVIVQFGGSIMQTLPLSSAQWGMCTAIGFLSLPIGYALKLVPAGVRSLSDIAPAPSKVGRVASKEVSDMHETHSRALAPDNAPDASPKEGEPKRRAKGPK